MKMNSRFKAHVQVAALLLALASLVYGVFLAAKASFRVVTSLDSDIAVAIIAASATVFVSVLSLVLGKIHETRIAIQKDLRERKVPAYEGLLSSVFQMLMGDKIGKPISEKEMLKFFFEYNNKMMIWGSDAVLADWSKWRKMLIASADSGGNGLVPAMLQYEKLILSVRRDLGHKNAGLNRGDILALFINDLDKYVPPGGS